jgi:hypothetical protein
VCFSQSYADVSVLIAYHDEGTEVESPTALNHLSDPVDMDDTLGQVESVSFDLLQIFSFSSTIPATRRGE